MSGRTAPRSAVPRRYAPGLVAACASAALLLATASAASAGVGAAIIPTFPQHLTAGDTGAPATLTISNFATDPHAGDPIRIDDITLVASCGTQGIIGDCPPGFSDPGVLVPGATATGRPGSGCAGRLFTVAEIDPAQAKYRFTAVPAPVLGASAGNPDLARCIIDFSVDVRRAPAVDANTRLSGLQTAQFAVVAVADDAPGPSFGQPGTGTGSAQTTIARAARASLATRASADTTLGAGTLSDSATVSGRVSPAAGATIDFSLFGPDDATCSGTPLLRSTVAYPAVGGAVTSASFTPTAVGAYRWIATYSGDVSNLPIAGACNDPAQTTTVAAAVEPPPPAPPGSPQPAPLPRILSATFESRPRAGREAVLRVRALDPARPIRGLRVSFGEARGRLALSACSQPGAGGSARPVTLRIPYSFDRSGRHRVEVALLAGGCETATASAARTIAVDVARRRASRVPQRDAGADCADGDRVPTASSRSRSRVSAAIACLVNAYRRRHGRVALRRSPRLARSAGAHSRDMVRRRYFSHVSPGGDSLQGRLTRVGYTGRSAGENIAWDAEGTAAAIVRAWINSPGHRSNMLRPEYRYAAAGVAVGVPEPPTLPGSAYTLQLGDSRG